MPAANLPRGAGKADAGKTKPTGGQGEKSEKQQQQTSARGLPSTRVAVPGQAGATMGKVIGGIQTEHTKVGFSPSQ